MQSYGASRTGLQPAARTAQLSPVLARNRVSASSVTMAARPQASVCVTSLAAGIFRVARAAGQDWPLPLSTVLCASGVSSRQAPAKSPLPTAASNRSAVPSGEAIAPEQPDSSRIAAQAGTQLLQDACLMFPM